MKNNETWTAKEKETLDMQKTYDCFKPKYGDIIRLELDKNVIDADIKQIKNFPYIKINEGRDNFSIDPNSEDSCGRIIEYIPEYYNIKEILKFILMFITKKPKKEYIRILWTLKQ
jgi:hypothetical protein